MPLIMSLFEISFTKPCNNNSLDGIKSVMGVKLFYSLKADSKIIPFFLAPTAQYLQFAHFNIESSISRVAKKGDITVVSYQNESFFIKMRAAFLFSLSSITRGRMGASKAALILMKNSHFDRTPHQYHYKDVV